MDVLRIELDKGDVDKELSLWCKGIFVAMQLPYRNIGKSFLCVNQKATKRSLCVCVHAYQNICMGFVSFQAVKIKIQQNLVLPSFYKIKG